MVGTEVEFRILGPIELWAQGRQHELGRPKERHILAVLLDAAGKPVPVERIIERVWDVAPPRTVENTLQAYISRLRSRLDKAVGDRVKLDNFARSYRLNVDLEDVDLFRFQRLHQQARSIAESGDAEQAVDLLRDAEALWRGEPFADLRGPWVEAARGVLGEKRLRARNERVRLELELGRHADLISELREIAAGPIVESAIANLMLALYRCGRQGEALAAYRDGWRRIDEELGDSPGPDLERLHQRILMRDPSLLFPEPPRDCQPSLPPPNNLIRDIDEFTGRVEELNALLAQGDPTSTALSLTVVHGMPGVGKTTLAIHAAHLLRERYPDGQLFVDLHAHSEQTARDPTDVLGTLLHMLGESEPDERLGGTLDERAETWRKRTARHKVLMVLDDVRDADQVRPLLPGAPTCCVIATSRHHLADLEGARSIFLDIPSTGEAVALFNQIAGSTRIDYYPAVHQVVEVCGRHPLAIRLAADRLRHRETWSVHDLVDRLAQAAGPLDAIDSLKGISTAFDLSYVELSRVAQRVFRYLALHPGSDFTLDSVTALTGMGQVDVWHALDELLDCHLTDEPMPGRYRFHDLVREYATRLGKRLDSEAERTCAVLRLLDYYIDVCDQSDRLIRPWRREFVGYRRPASAAPAPFADSGEAVAWLNVERANLLAAARLAARQSPLHIRLFPHVLAQALQDWGVWQEADELYVPALAASRENGDMPEVAQLLVERATVLRLRGAYAQAVRCAEEAGILYHDAGDAWGQGEALSEMALARLVSGRFGEALSRFDEALTLHRRVGNHRSEAEALHQRGAALAYAGRHREALEHFHASLDRHREIGNRRGEVKALNNIGEMHNQSGEFEAARVYYERSLALMRQIGGQQELAILENNLGNLCRNTGETVQALSYYRKALVGFRAIRDLRCEADTLINIGLTYQQTGRHSEAGIHFAKAERLAQQIGDQYHRQHALACAAATQRDSGRYGLALATFREAIQVAQAIDTPLEEAQATEGLALTLLATQGAEAARSHFERALAIYERLEAPEAAAVRQRLLPPPATGS